MNASIAILDRLYMGDSYCKKIIIDSENDEVRFCVNTIIITADDSTEWNPSRDKSISDGFIVFKNVSRFKMNPDGLIPNDSINYWEYRKIENVEQTCVSYEVNFFITHCSEIIGEDRIEVKLTLIVEGVLLEDSNGQSLSIL